MMFAGYTATDKKAATAEKAVIPRTGLPQKQTRLRRNPLPAAEGELPAMTRIYAIWQQISEILTRFAKPFTSLFSRIDRRKWDANREENMSNRGTPVVALVGAALLFSTTAMAGEMGARPAYVGERSSNPEQETYASIVANDDVRSLAFIEPARSVGAGVGDPEKDTIAYQFLSTVPRESKWALCTEGH